MSWFRDVRRGAAYELGRRLWRWFAALEIIGWFVRRVLPILLIMASLGLAVWLAVRTAAWWMPRILALAAIAGSLTVLTRLAYRYRWEIRAGLPRPAVATVVVALAGVLGTAVWWLR
ncbi:hypothetical protein M1L60_29700 [Actinoplanes sp. TRM 88003]|uniref:DUF202 domain-containing protein n=1 Tax=Paractinoplanes aksuensis TaxID=2939490 RepID=A0ABT1DVC8_9ACTN|nr:hypothetical protein [Actinoplanes aksuensis]MCO8274778.1 hypothetical protein [Actinoplanes aksuensis]